MSLAHALEEAAQALPALADAIRPANGDPTRLRATLAPAEATQVLAWLLEARPEAGEELAEAWAEDPEGAETLAGISEASLSKPGRKALRRLRHRLRSRGVELPEESRTPRVATLPDLDDRIAGARVSPLDPSGARIVYLVEPHPQGGARLFEVVLDDARGLLGFDVYGAPRRKARAFLRELEGRPRFPVVEVEEEAARALVARAVASHPKDRPLPRGFAEWRSHLTPEDEKTPPPGAHAAETLGSGTGAGRVEAVEALVREGRVGPWPPSEEVLRGLFERVRESRDSKLVVSGAARQERLADLLDEAVDEVYDEAGARIAAHRLRETAYVLGRTGDPEAARDCLAAAEAFEAREGGHRALARVMLETALGPALEALERESSQAEDAGDTEGGSEPEGADEEPSRIVKP